MSDQDRQRMALLARSLEQVETDEEPTPSARAAAIEAADRWRAEHLIPPLAEPDLEPPELELYRRARALGLRRRRR